MNYVDKKLKKQESCQSMSIYSSLSKNDGGPVDIDLIAQGKEIRTNLMVKNIPCKYQKYEIREDFELKHNNRFNKLKYPQDKTVSEKTGKGYCFVNFRHPLYVYDFIKDKNNYHWPRHNSDKTIEIHFAND